MDKSGEMTVWLAEPDSNEPMLLGSYQRIDYTISYTLEKDEEESDES